MRRRTLKLLLAAAVVWCGWDVAHAQAAPPPPRDTVVGILPPKKPLPPEAQSAGVTRFSFIAYGDTRGRRDGVAEQYESSPATPGGEGVLSVDLVAGRWVLLCPIPGPTGTPHFADGMLREFTI